MAQITVGLNVSPIGIVSIVLGQHDDDSDRVEFAMLNIQEAVTIAMSILNQAQMGHKLWQEIQQVPPDDREAYVCQIAQRFNSGMN